MTEECITCHEPRLMYEFHDPCRSCRAISTSCLMCPVEPCYCLPNIAVASNGTICALRVNGEKVEVSVHESDALEDVKNEIAEAFKFKLMIVWEICPGLRSQHFWIPIMAKLYRYKPRGHGGTLKLFFGNEEIKDGQQWGETGVPPGSCVQVVLQMWSQNSRPVETVTLALSWECIGRTRYLNGSALLYSGSTRMKTVDFFDGNHGDGHSITHSGKAYSWDLSQKLETPRVLLQEPNRTSCAVRRGLHARLISHAWRHLSMQSTLRSAATAPCAAMIHTFAIFMIPPSRSLPTRQKS
eukprot:GEMP01045496.1.p1 GENE.GEMP01045496.1~~GEMP01045496.1.p1  ORF type:complete len:313 (+),score=34.25 GEMP01045496.1:51-941(+)